MAKKVQKPQINFARNGGAGSVSVDDVENICALAGTPRYKIRLGVDKSLWCDVDGPFSLWREEAIGHYLLAGPEMEDVSGGTLLARFRSD